MDEITRAILLLLVGALLGGGIDVLKKIREERRLRGNIASAFYGEISTLLKIVNIRNLQNLVNDWVVHIDEHAGIVDTLPSFQIRSIYFDVYQTHIKDLGLLRSPLPEKISSVYLQAKAIMEILQVMEEDRSKYSEEEAKSDLIALNTLLKSALNDAEESLSLLRIYM